MTEHNPDRLRAVARTHNLSESAGDLDVIMSTMEGEPVYEFHPVGLRFSGMATTRRYYEHYVTHFKPRVAGSRFIGEWAGETGLVQEYCVTLRAGDGQPESHHRIVAVLVYGAEGLSGERMYTDDVLLRAMLGPLWDELEPIPAG